MRRGIFFRLMLVNITSTVICILLTGGILFSSLIYYTTENKSEALLEEAERINEMTLIYFGESYSAVSEKVYKVIIEDVGKRLDGAVMIFDNNGKIVIASPNINEHITSNLLNKNLFDRIIAPEGDSILGNLDGFLKGTYLTVSTPLKFDDHQVGATCISVPMPEVTRIIFDVFSIFIPAVLCAVSIAVLVAYLMSMRILKPIKNLSRAASRVALGDFDVRLEVKGEDEISGLCATFNRMTESLQKLDMTSSDFIANVSHELRTPMTTISGFIEGILDGTIPEEKREQYLSIVSDEIKRMARLVSELLMLARLEGGESKLNMTDFDINEQIRLTILGMESRLAEKNINVDVQLDKSQPFVNADRDAVSRVLINLFDNAIKFNVPDGYIKAGTRVKGNKVIVYVENTGAGISKEEQLRIWDRFYKSDKSRSYDKKGLGLGLYLVHSLLAEHGEQIKVESVPDKYTRFTFTLKKS
ncbi:MAG: HAMP domain-containing histidine kinase [Clostridia bacterium]|nr:HAMP domain-containing histidine kinase [Clostridia bacterium]